jgi:hypothetical protein
MNSRLILNLFMLIGVLALIAVILYKPCIEPAKEIPPLTALSRDQINKLEIIRAADRLILERTQQGWQIAGTPPLAADDYQINVLLALAEARPERSYPASSLDLATLKLAPAQMTVHLDTTEIRFGDTDPLEGLRYVQIGEQVHLIMDNYQSILQGKRTQLASRRLLPDGADIVGIELPKLKLSKQDNAWHIDPAPERLSADAPQKLVQAWTTASALWVREYQKAESQPISITLADGQRITFELRSGKGEYVLARPDLGVQYQLPEDVTKPLLELEQPEAESAAQDAPVTVQP